MANFFSPNFRWSNLALLVETWIFRVLLTLAFFVGLIGLAIWSPTTLGYVLATNYVLYLGLELLQWLVLMYYSPNPRRDGGSLTCLPLMPIYQVFLKSASLVALVEEFFWRRSFRDTFVPAHVSQATWRW